MPKHGSHGRYLLIISLIEKGELISIQKIIVDNTAVTIGILILLMVEILVKFHTTFFLSLLKKEGRK